jgi:hypothetical protein
LSIPIYSTVLSLQDSILRRHLFTQDPLTTQLQFPNYLDHLILFLRQEILESLRVSRNVLNSIAVSDSCILPALYSLITNHSHLHNVIRGVAWRGVAWRGVAWRGVAFTLHPHLASRFKKECTDVCFLSGPL